QDDGVPVYLKGGTKDKILYRATLGLLGIGLIMCLEFVVQNIKKI
ncbi:polypeptide VII, cytochrome c oxidase, partial [Diachasma alloeum]